MAQIETIRPAVILALGNFAAQTLLGTKEGITSSAAAPSLPRSCWCPPSTRRSCCATRAPSTGAWPGTTSSSRGASTMATRAERGAVDRRSAAFGPTSSSICRFDRRLLVICVLRRRARGRVAPGQRVRAPLAAGARVGVVVALRSGDAAGLRPVGGRRARADPLAGAARSRRAGSPREPLLVGSTLRLSCRRRRARSGESVAPPSTPAGAAPRPPPSSGWTRRARRLARALRGARRRARDRARHRRGRRWARAPGRRAPRQRRARRGAPRGVVRAPPRAGPRRGRHARRAARAAASAGDARAARRAGPGPQAAGRRRGSTRATSCSAAPPSTAAGCHARRPPSARPGRRRSGAVVARAGRGRRPWPEVIAADTRGILRNHPLTPPLTRAIEELRAPVAAWPLIVSRSAPEPSAATTAATVLRCPDCGMALACARPPRLACRLCARASRCPSAARLRRPSAPARSAGSPERVEASVRRRFPA